jgi:cytochrome b561
MDRAARAFIPFRNTESRYGVVAQSLHWLIVILVAVQFMLGITAHDLPISLERLVLLTRHKAFGMTILMLMLLRLAWRLYSASPALPAGMDRLQRRLAELSHVLLYILLLTMPVVGWLSSSASNLTVSWFGLFHFPNLVSPDPALAKSMKALHIALAWVLLALISVHAAAALWHQFVRKDGVLMRMLPHRPHEG